MSVPVLGLAIDALSTIAAGAGRQPTIARYAERTLELIADQAADAWPVVYCVTLEAAGPWCGAELCHAPAQRLGSTPDGRPVIVCATGHYTAMRPAYGHAIELEAA